MRKTTNDSFLFSPELDNEALQTLYENDFVYTSEVFTMFLKDTKNEFEQIKKSYKEHEIATIRQKLHKIKPTFSFVGLGALTIETESLICRCDTCSSIDEIAQECLALFEKIEQSFVLIERELIRMKEYT